MKLMHLELQNTWFFLPSEPYEFLPETVRDSMLSLEAIFCIVRPAIILLLTLKNTL